MSGLNASISRADRPQLVLHAGDAHLVPRLAQRVDDVIAGLEGEDILLACNP